MAAMTFDEAWDIVDREVHPIFWPDTDSEAGTWYVAAEGLEDAQGFVLHAGAREWFIDGDFDYVLLDGPVWLVDKATGKVTEQEPMVEPFGSRMLAMTPVSGSGAEPKP